MARILFFEKFHALGVFGASQRAYICKNVWRERPKLISDVFVQKAEAFQKQFIGTELKQTQPISPPLACIFHGKHLGGAVLPGVGGRGRRAFQSADPLVRRVGRLSETSPQKGEKGSFGSFTGGAGLGFPVVQTGSKTEGARSPKSVSHEDA